MEVTTENGGRVSEKDGPLWRLELLGGQRLKRGNLPIVLPGSRKVNLLLSYLTFRQTPQPREELIDLLWPESTLEAGRNSLSNALSTLRSVLGGSVLVTTHAVAGLRRETLSADISDLERLQRLARAATDFAERRHQWEQIMTLYGGAFLPGCYEDWALTARAHFEVIYQEATESLLRLLIDQGDFDRAIHHGLQAIHHCPSWEQAHVALISLYAAKGLPSAALRQYEELSRVLGDLGMVPTPALRRWAEQTREAVTSPAEKRPASPGELSTSQGDHGLLPCSIPPHLAFLTLDPQQPALSQSTRTSLLGEEPALDIRAMPADLWGREEELTSLTTLFGPALGLGDHATARTARTNPAFVTLTGPAGVGKTRLETATASIFEQAGFTRMVFVPLTSLADALLIFAAVARALKLEMQSDPLSRIAAELGERPFLLILDNLEHLLPSGRDVLDTLRKHLPNLSLLITSRHRVALHEEREVFIKPLQTPPMATTGLAEAQNFDSVRLFVERASAVSSQFQLTQENCRDVAALCRRLDGLPLALELAAGWARVLTPAQMLARLSQRLGLLAKRQSGNGIHTSGNDSFHGGQDARHDSLETALTWGWHLLVPAVQRFLAGVSVFQGGWTLGAAEEVCHEALALEYLAQLQEQSWIVAEERDGEVRFRLLVTIQDFLVERLAEQRETIRRGHAAYFLAFIQHGGPARNIPVRHQWLRAISREQDNVRAALHWCQEHDPELGLCLAVALHEFWVGRGFVEEGVLCLRELISRQPAGTAPLLLANAHNALAKLSVDMGDFAGARQAFTEAQVAARQAGDEEAEMRASSGLGRACLRQGEYNQAERLISTANDFFRGRGDQLFVMASSQGLGLIKLYQGQYAEAQALLGEAARLAEKIGDQMCLADSLTNQGLSAYLQTDHAQARRLLTRALTVYSEVHQDKPGRLTAIDLLGTIEVEAGHLELAQDLYQQAIASSRKTGNRFNLAASSGNLGFVALRRGLYSESGAAFRESLMLCRDMNEKRIVTSVLEGVSTLLLALNRALPPARLLGAAQALRQALEMPVAAAEQKEMEDLHHSLSAALGDASKSLETECGLTLSWQEAIDLALAELSGF